jgi:two-component system, NtrC family, response regulator HydG
MTGSGFELWQPEFASLIIDAMAEGVFTLDADRRITSWNRAMTQITGYEAQEALGQTCRFFEFNRCFQENCPPDFKACGILKMGQVNGKECELRHRDGHRVPVIKNARVIPDGTGGILGIVETVTDLTELKETREKAEAAERRLGERHQFGNIIGKSPGMTQVFSAVTAAAASETTVLIQGESGTGKELVAGAIHYNGARSSGPLVTVNCAALSESLLESELFGHIRGAFTGALRDRIGRFEEAHGGTIFLDEIGEISPFIQVKLLRVLQDREIERVGESRARRIDIRVIAATHQDLVGLVKRGRFREDLFYRLKVFPIVLPPLRRRREDIPPLIQHFIARLNKRTGKTIEGVSTDAMRLLMDYPWEGNVRELENAIEHAFVLCHRGLIGADALPVEIRRMRFGAVIPAAPAAPSSPGLKRPVVTPDSLRTLLAACHWNKAEVARRMGVSRTWVWKYMKKWDIPLRKDGPGEAYPPPEIWE